MSKKQRKQGQWNPPSMPDNSGYGWAIYFSGGMVSFSSYKILAAIISAIGLILIMIIAANTPKDPFIHFRIKKFHRLQIIFILSFAICFFFKLTGCAYLILGASFFLYGCFCLKHQAVYLNTSIFDPYGTPYSRATHPFTYWSTTVLFLSLGALLLLAIPWAGRWYQE